MRPKLPYMASPGLLPKILGKIQAARRPERFTQDFLETKLGYTGGSARAIIPLLKRMGFLSSDGVPTRLYDQFRNAETQGTAVAQGMKNAYFELFDRNEYVYELSKDRLTSLVTEITGKSREDTTTRCIVSTFQGLKGFADFEYESPTADQVAEAPPSQQLQANALREGGAEHEGPFPEGSVGLNVSYTINLNLPETTNPDVFNAIFRSLRENLLRRQ